MIEIYTDGACEPNPGPGGWAFVIPALSVEQSGYDAQTTNNRMEMMAAVKALEHLDEGMICTIHTDSQYLRDGMLKWVDAWKKRQWKTKRGTDVLNKDLWMQLDELRQTRRVFWKWIRGHNGHVHNERCDELAGIALYMGGDQ